MPCQHNLKDWLREYIEAAGIGEEKGTPLFRSVDRKTKELNIHRTVNISRTKSNFRCH
jgi:hypothetical protein